MGSELLEVRSVKVMYEKKWKVTKKNGEEEEMAVEVEKATKEKCSGKPLERTNRTEAQQHARKSAH